MCLHGGAREERGDQLRVPVSPPLARPPALLFRYSSLHVVAWGYCAGAMLMVLVVTPNALDVADWTLSTRDGLAILCALHVLIVCCKLGLPTMGAGCAPMLLLCPTAVHAPQAQVPRACFCNTRASATLSSSRRRCATHCTPGQTSPRVLSTLCAAASPSRAPAVQRTAGRA